MFGWLRGRTPRRRGQPGLAAAGVRDEADAEYRTIRIARFVDAMPDPTAERVEGITAFLDRWHIVETSAGYVPHPLWDDEPLLTRTAYPTRDEAVAAVRALSGDLTEDADRA